MSFFPKLRFSEFSEPWVKVKAGDILVEISSGWSPECEQKKVTSNEWGVLTTSSVTWDGYDETENKKLPQFLKPRENLRVNKGDILITRAGPVSRVGVVARVNEEPQFNLMLSDKLIRIKGCEKVDGKFLATSLKQPKIQRYFVSRKSGLAEAQSNISQPIIKNIPLNIPSVEEQQKIADFLSTVDEKIRLLNEKHALLQQYKKGVMQKLFSQEIRFKDENGQAFPAWRLQAIGKYLLEHKERVSADTSLPILTSSREGLYLQERKVFNEGEYGVLPQGYFTYRHMSDDLIFKFNLNLCWEKAAVSKEYPVFKTSKGLNAHFLEYCLNEGSEFKRFAIQQKVGGTRTRLYFKNLCQLKLQLPCEKEQQKIVEFLQTLHKKLDAVQQQIDLTQTFKKGLLQQMFV